jgi:trehalose synthase
VVQLVDVQTRLELADYAASAHLAYAVHELELEARQISPRLRGRTVWMVSSTARGGGVAEMLPARVALLRQLGIATEWAVIETDQRAFFPLTKQLHNMLHGVPCGSLGARERALYDEVSRSNADALAAMISPDDVVVVHDPQPLGAAALLKQRLGITAVWRCHIGLDEPQRPVLAAWDFLRPYAELMDRSVFSAAEYVPAYLAGRASVIHPAIDPLSHKNRELSLHKLVGILADAALLVPPGPLVYERFAHGARRLQTDGRWAPATVPDDIGLLARPIVTQISRWDRLKGFGELLEAFRLLKLRHLAAGEAGDPAQRRRRDIVRLVLAGPDPTAIADDPEGHEVVADLRARYLALEPVVQRDVAIVTLPMASPKENALMVNVLQRAASVVVQNSLREGFGLTVAEAMWKRAPILGNSRALGIRHQVRDGIDGRLVRDPEDVTTLAAAMDAMLADPQARSRWGQAGQRRVHDNFLLFGQLRAWFRLFLELGLGAPRVVPQRARPAAPGP